jgi:hypothetical protein
MWKMIFLKNGSRELYHLGNDIGETKEVSRDNPDVVRELSALMNRYVSEGRSTPGETQPSSAKYMDPNRFNNKPSGTKQQKKKSKGGAP